MHVWKDVVSVLFQVVGEATRKREGTPGAFIGIPNPPGEGMLS